MSKKIVKRELDKLVAEATIGGEKTTKSAQKTSKDQNNAYYRDVKKKMADYDKEITKDGENAIEPKKTNIEGDTKELHDELETMNGQEQITYNLEPSETFKDRAEKAITGDSTMGNEVYTGDENGNTESTFQASDDEFGEKLIKRAKSSKEKRNDSVSTAIMFGDDIERVPDEDPRITNKKLAYEGMKRIKFKKPFNGVGNALKLIPEAFRVDNKQFEMTDGDESYKVKWVGSLQEGRAVVLEANSKDLMNEDFSKIKHLMNYKAQNTLGLLNSQERVNENNVLKSGLVIKTKK